MRTAALLLRALQLPALFLVAETKNLFVRSANLIRREGSFRTEAHAHLHSDFASGHLKHLYPWYHTSEELLSEVDRLAGVCNGMLSKRTASDSDVHIDVLRVRDASANASNRVFVVFGEHSRELISPESGLAFLRMLCGEVPPDARGTSGPSPADVLKDSEFEIVLNGNPRSRLKVEDGNFCVRANPDGVDLNRNWDEKWESVAENYLDANPGPRPFSEPETRIFRQLVTDYKPTTFLTVHSGTRGLYMPWAYDTKHLASRNEPSMMEILRGLDEGHCHCPYGAAGKEVGYSCPGTSLDWVYDQLTTPYAFAFEIYTSPERDMELSRRWEEKVRLGGTALLWSGSSLGHPHFLDLFQDHTSDFVQTAQHNDMMDGMDEPECFGMFNPPTQESYDATVSNWAVAYLEMAQKVVADMRSRDQVKTRVAD